MCGSLRDRIRSQQKELAAVLIAGGRQPQEDLLDLAHDEKVNVLSTPLSTYEVVGRLYELGIR